MALIFSTMKHCIDIGRHTVLQWSIGIGRHIVHNEAWALATTMTHSGDRVGVTVSDEGSRLVAILAHSEALADIIGRCTYKTSPYRWAARQNDFAQKVSLTDVFLTKRLLNNCPTMRHWPTYIVSQWSRDHRTVHNKAWSLVTRMAIYILNHRRWLHVFLNREWTLPKILSHIGRHIGPQWKIYIGYLTVLSTVKNGSLWCVNIDQNMVPQLIMDIGYHIV